VYAALERRRIETWYTTPMTLKRLMEGGAELVRGYDLSRLKLIATVGQSLTPDVFFWVKEHLGRSPHDTWWMAETGMICISNFPSELIKPGSMGKPTPGIEAAVMDMGGEPLPIYSLGELALKAPWPSLMKGIWRDDERHAAYFRDGWFLTGDMVVKDEDGYYYHQGRNDDLIRIGPAPVGPYEFEHAFRLHPAVMDAAVIAKNSETGDVIVKAFVELRMDHSASDRLARTLATFVDERLHCGASLIEIVFVNELPKTRTGKLLRRALRAMELGLPLGDTRNLKAESE
jgi:acetyl-CoA synthetase